jgi:hypothetical protein
MRLGGTFEFVDVLWEERLLPLGGALYKYRWLSRASESSARMGYERWGSPHVPVVFPLQTLARTLAYTSQLQPYQQHSDNDDSNDMFPNLAVSTT